jgi:hypothetical protein
MEHYHPPRFSGAFNLKDKSAEIVSARWPLLGLNGSMGVFSGAEIF